MQRVLVIDDEASVRLIVKRVLSPTYEVRELADGEGLEQTLAEFAPDLLILDVNLPTTNGRELCQRLRKERSFDRIPVMFLSGLGDHWDVRQGFAAGGDFYFPKPFNVYDLLQVVELLVGRPHRLLARA